MNGHHLEPVVPRVAAGNKIEPVGAKMEMLEMLDARETPRTGKTADLKHAVSNSSTLKFENSTLGY